MRWSFLSVMLAFILLKAFGQGNKFYIDHTSPTYYTPQFFKTPPTGGDTIFVDTSRTESLIFNGISGTDSLPLVIINHNGKVEINSVTNFSAIEFRNCKHIILSGSGSNEYFRGFKLAANSSGISINNNSNDIEIGHIEIDHRNFFGIVAKDDYHGNPPLPVPVFEKLAIHDCLIKNVTESMYLGETTTPGMEFRHVRIYNNIMYGNGREGIQIANMVDDVEVYNNLIINSGQAKEGGQGNNFQIGDNTVGSFYNNIIYGANENGVIVFGSGEINIFNNYIAYNRGIFIDNRKITDTLANITVRNNFFSNITNENILTNYNELNPMQITNNKWEGIGHFYHSIAPYNHSVLLENNITSQILPLQLIDTANNNFNLDKNNPELYLNMGPQSGLGHRFNCTPVIDSIKNVILESGSDTTLVIGATTCDNDTIEITVSKLPNFAYSTKNEKGQIALRLSPQSDDVGIYSLLITATDYSNQAKERQILTIAVRSKNNSPPVLEFPERIDISSNTQHQFLISYSDVDNDEVSIRVENLPSFASLVKTNNQYFIDFRPRYMDDGVFERILIIATDGFNKPDSVEFMLVVERIELSQGDVVYRVNCGGPNYADEPIYWEGNYLHQLDYELSSSYSTGSHVWSGYNKTGAPSNIFGTYNYSIFPKSIDWLFPCINGDYIVNLFFAEQEEDVINSNQSIFSIKINDLYVEENFNILTKSEPKALKKTYITNVENNQIEIRLLPVIQEARLNGIEIIYFFLQSEHFMNNGIKAFQISTNQVFDFFFLLSTKGFLDGIYFFELYNNFGQLITEFNQSAEHTDKMKISLHRSQIRGGLYFLKISDKNNHSEIFRLILTQ
jgi:hypothetical protein